MALQELNLDMIWLVTRLMVSEKHLDLMHYILKTKMIANDHNVKQGERSLYWLI